MLSTREAEPNGVSGSRMSLQDRLKQFVKDTFLVDDVGAEESFLANGIIDSLGVLHLVAFVEGVIGTKVPDTDLLPENFDSVARVCAYIERFQEQAA